MEISLPAEDKPIELISAGDVEALVERVYGATLATTGLIEAVEVWQGDYGRYLKLIDDREAPRCCHGRLVSSLNRARADAILTSDARLRQQPAFDHQLRGPGRSAIALAEWRRERLGKSDPPVTLVVASGDELDLDHPVLHHWTRPVVFTTHQAQWQLESRAVDLGIEVVGADEPTARGAVDFLRRAFGAATIALELASSHELYREPVAVDEVLLTTCRATHISPAVLGEPFLTAEELARRFPHHSAPYRLRSGDDNWSLQRFLR